MKFYSVRFFLAVLGVLVCADQAIAWQEVMQRINVGYVLKHRSNMNLKVDQAMLHFAINLPDISEPKTIKYVDCVNITINMTRQQEAGCRTIYELIKAIHIVHTKTVNAIHERLQNIHETLESFPIDNDQRSRRGLGSFIGGIISSTFGLETEESATAIRETLSKIQQSVYTASEAWTSSTGKYATLLHVQQEKMSHLSTIIKDHEQSMSAIYDSFSKQLRNFEMFERTTALTIRKVSDYIMTIIDAESLKTSLDSILNADLSPHLLPISQLQQSLDTLQQHLTTQNLNLTLIYPRAFHYYRDSNFLLSRINSTLLLSVIVPLTTLPTLHVYDVTLVNMPVPGKQMGYSTLKTDIKTIIWDENVEYYIAFPYIFQASNNLIDIAHTEIQLRSVNEQTCAAAIIRGRLDELKANCQYSVYSTRPPMQVLRISPTEVLLTSVNEALLMCSPPLQNPIYHQTEIQTVLVHSCSCRVQVENIIIPPGAVCNSSARTPKFLFTANLPLLSGLFEKEEMRYIFEDSLHNNPLQVDIPEIKIKSAEHNILLEKDKETEIELEHAIESIVNDTTVYTSLSHYLFEKMTEESAQPSQFHVYSFYSWIQLAAIISSFLALAISIYLFLRTKAFLTMAVIPTRVSALNLSKNLKPPELSPLVYTHRSSTNLLSPSNDTKILSYTEVIEHAENFISADVLLSLIVFILVVIWLTKFCKDRKTIQKATETNIYLEIGSNKHAVRYYWQKLTFPIANYTLKIKPPKATIQVINRCFFSRIRLNIGSLSLSHKQFSTVITVTKTSRMLLKHEVRKVVHMMNHDYYVALIMISGSDTMSVALLRPLNLVGEFIGQEAEQREGVDMYPPKYNIGNLYPEISQLLTHV